MLRNIVPILYFSPSIIEQIVADSQGRLLVSETQTKSSNKKINIKAVLEKLWEPVKAEAQGEYGDSKQTVVNSTYTDLSRAIDAVRQAQEQNRLIASGKLPEIGDIPNMFTLLEGDFSIKPVKSPVDGKYYVNIVHKSDGLQIHGLTSMENWTERSTINQLLASGKLNAAALIFPLSINQNKIEAKFACIFIMRD